MEIQPLIEGHYFHIYNRGVNGENLFKEKKNYSYFSERYIHYCADVLETYAYCLLKNHFHLVAYVKENVEEPRKNGEGTFRLNASRQLSHFFNSYAQSINKAYKRTGPLFESPFERKLIENDDYLTSVICYCHHNPQLHGFVKDFKEWEFSSYRAIINNDCKLVTSKKVLDRFGGMMSFVKAHEIESCNKDWETYRIESTRTRLILFHHHRQVLNRLSELLCRNESYRRL